MQETWVQFLGQEYPLEKEMATHSSILAWRIPWTEESDRLHSMGLQESDTTEWVNHHHHIYIYTYTYTYTIYTTIYTLYTQLTSCVSLNNKAYFCLFSKKKSLKPLLMERLPLYHHHYLCILSVEETGSLSTQSFLLWSNLTHNFKPKYDQTCSSQRQFMGNAETSLHPGDPVDKTLSSQCNGPGFHPWLGN